MNFKTIFMPSKATQALISSSVCGIVIPKGYLLAGENLVLVEGLKSTSPMKLFDYLDLQGFLPKQIAVVCGFENDASALEFMRVSYKNPNLELKDLAVYRITA